jgi:hypothetical protein
MRSRKVLGRFDIDFEAQSIYKGMTAELADTVGVTLDWWRWDTEFLRQNVASIVDDIYDTSSQTSVSGGRVWKDPLEVQALTAQIIRGSNVMNDRGFYVVDTLRIVFNVGQLRSVIPTMLTDPAQHIKDRITYKGQVYTPTRVLPRGHFGDRWAVITVDCNHVSFEELVNDKQFRKYSSQEFVDLRNIEPDDLPDLPDFPEEPGEDLGNDYP